MPKYTVGTTAIADPNVTDIALEQLKVVIQGLPEGKAIELLKQLPKETVRKICEEGAKEEAGKYLPWVIGGVVALIVVKNL